MAKKIVRYVRREQSEDIVRSSLSEIVMFLLFFFLILLGSEAVTSIDGSKATGDLTLLRSKYDDCVEKTTLCEGKFVEINRERNEFEAAFSVCENELQSCETQDGAQNADLRDVRSSELACRGKLSACGLENDELTVRQANVEGDLSSCRSDRNVCDKLTSEQQGSIEHLNGRLSRLGESNEECLRDIVVCSGVESDLRGQLATENEELIECRQANSKCTDIVSNLEEKLHDTTGDYLHCRQSLDGCASQEHDLASCTQELTSCMSGNRWPPVFDLSEARGYSFASGRSELSLSFQRQLKRRIIPLIENAVRNPQFEITTIEIIGHTDEVPVGRSASNLDQQLTRHLGLENRVSELVPSDNAGLGLTRAVAVRSFLIRDGRLHRYKIIALSAAQGVEADGSIATGSIVKRSEPRRRRIEIRLRGEAETYN